MAINNNLPFQKKGQVLPKFLNSSNLSYFKGPYCSVIANKGTDVVDLVILKVISKKLTNYQFKRKMLSAIIFPQFLKLLMHLLFFNTQSKRRPSSPTLLNLENDIRYFVFTAQTKAKIRSVTCETSNSEFVKI